MTMETLKSICASLGYIAAFILTSFSVLLHTTGLISLFGSLSMIAIALINADTINVGLIGYSLLGWIATLVAKEFTKTAVLIGDVSGKLIDA